MSEPAQSDLSLLFATDPFKLTRGDRKPIIEYYRASRERFVAGGQKAPTKEPKAKAKGGAVDLDLDLEL